MAAIEGGIRPYVVDIEPTAPTVLSPATDPPEYGTPGFGGHGVSLDPGGLRALAIRERQDREDISHDTADLRRAIQAALQTDHDSAMIEILQISREEIPEAIKTIRRALKRESRREQDAEEAMLEDVEIVSKKPAFPHSQAGYNRSPTSWDTLFSEFLGSGVGALLRMSKGTDLFLPSWTIAKWEVDCDGKIGDGASSVYRGTWGGVSVAVKMLAPTAPRELFIREVEIWNRLSHPNVLELLGASSASGEPPWFLVSPYVKHGSLDKYLKSAEPRSQINLLKMVYEIALGMEYLHKRSVLHGNLKVRRCARVSVD